MPRTMRDLVSSVRPLLYHPAAVLTMAASAISTRRAKTWREFMRFEKLFTVVPVLTLLAIGASQAQITSNPIPEPIVKKGIAVEIKDVVRLPDTRGIHREDDVLPAGWARISYVRELPDGRRFANDSRGFIYFIDASNKVTVYANVAEAFPYAIYNRLESGLIGFVFHPDFARNGLFYTVHSE